MSNSPEDHDSSDAANNQPGQWHTPGGASSGQPPYQQPQYQQPPHQQPPYYQPPHVGAPYGPGPAHPYGPYQPTKPEPLSFGSKLGIGVAAGIILAGIIIALIFLALLAVSWTAALLISLVIPAAAIIAMFFAPTRAYATGVLIAMAAAWLTVIGPCLAIIRV